MSMIIKIQTINNGFETVFQKNTDGTLMNTKECLEKVEEWFNKNYLYIDLICGVGIKPIYFKYDQSKEDEILLTQTYALSYTAYLRMKNIIEKEKK
jgi:hypothetical protein